MVKNCYNFRNQQKIKDEQINYLSGDLEKNLEDYREAIEIKEKQLAEAKRILVAAKQSFDKVLKGNRDLKAYIENLKQHFQQQQINFLNQQKAFYSRQNKTPKKYKRVEFEEENESENEPEFEEEEESENEEIVQEPKTKKSKKTIIIITFLIK